MDAFPFDALLTSALLGADYSIYPHSQLVANDADLPARLTDLAAWATEYLTNPHPELGRTGAVCPFTRPSIRQDVFFVVDTLSAPAIDEDITALLYAAKAWQLDTASKLAPEVRHLLTVMIPTPWLDPDSSDPIDQVQAELKDAYVPDGLMIGQFHPASEQPGVWNHAFHPLRAPMPLLVIRFMVPGDIAFLKSSPTHLDGYLKRFAPEIPARARSVITELAH